MLRSLLGICAAIGLALAQRRCSQPRVLELGHGIFEAIGVAVGTDPVRALALTDMALVADPAHVRTLEVRLAILRALDRAPKNSNERGWLAAAMRDVETRVKR